MPDDRSPTAGANEAIEALLAAARGGSIDALGRIFESARRQLLAAADRELPAAVRAKIAPSDIVQETALDANRDFPQFTGTTAEECFAWLRSILKNNVVDAIRRFEQSLKRDTGREISMASGSGKALGESLPVAGHAPDGSAMRREDAATVKRLLARLPPDYQDVIEMRYWEGLSFPEIAIRLDRSPEAVRKLWYRALQRLDAELGSLRRAGVAGDDDSPLALEPASSTS